MTLPAVELRRIGPIIALAVGWVGMIVLIVNGYDFSDLRDYREAVNAWLSGEPLYSYVEPGSGKGFDYPPMAAVLLTPLLVWPAPVAITLVTIVNLALLAFCVHVVLSPLRKARNWPLVPTLLAATLIAAALEPVRQALGYGQLSLILTAVILADVLAVKKGRRWAGIGIGLASALQFTFVLFLIYLFLCRRWRAGFTALLTILAVVVASLVLVPDEVGTYMSKVLFNPEWVGQIGDANNQALSGLMARLYDQAAPTITWLGFAVFGAAWGLSRAVEAHKADNELAAVATIGLAATVFSPIGWTYQLVWIIPCLAVMLAWMLEPAPRRIRKALMERPWSRRSATAAVWVLFVVAPIWWVAVPQDQHWGENLAHLITSNSFFVLAVLLIGLLPREVSFTAAQPPKTATPQQPKDAPVAA